MRIFLLYYFLSFLFSQQVLDCQSLILNFSEIIFYFRNMTRSHVKYQIARDDVDPSEYLAQNVPDFQNVMKPEPTFWNKAFHVFLLISIYFILSIGLTFYNPWLYNTYVSNCTDNSK